MSPRVYEAPKADEFDPRKLSPSRMNALSKCGVAFDMKYVQGLPEERSGSAALFGNVVHEALEKWAPNREQDLLTLMRQAWLSITEGTAVNDFLGEYQALSVAAIKQEHAIREAWAAKGKVSKAPRMTKDWKDSEVAKSIGKLMGRWSKRLNDESPWRFKESDQLPALYDESLVLSRRYQARWGHLPPALYTEFAFDVEWHGFRLNGYIDSIELLLDRTSGELVGVGVIDYKTYAKPPAQHKDYRQLVMYLIAVRDLVERGVFSLPTGVPILVGVDYVRWNDQWVDEQGNPFPARRYWQMGDEDEARLLRECNAYLSTVEAKAFLPAEKGSNPDFCPFPSSCCLRNCAAAGGEAIPVAVAQ